MNLNRYEHWIALYVNGDNVKYLYSYGVEYISGKNRKFIGNINIITINYRIQACDAIMCRYFCTGFIDFMLKSKSLLDYTNIFFANIYQNNDKVILKYFQLNLYKLKYKNVLQFCSKYRKPKKTKISYILKITLSFFINYIMCG